MQKRLTLLIVLSLLLSVFVIPAASQDQTELRIAWWGSQNRHDRTIAVIELYESLNPDIDIVYEFSGWDDHWTKMSTQAAGTNLPDIMQQDYARIEEWVDNGLLLPLDPYIESGVIDTTNISDASLEGGIVDGQLYGFNLGNNSEMFVLDVDAFEAAGVELPPLDWTWSDFEQISRALNENLGVYAHSGGLENEQQWKGLYISCCDAYAYNAEGTGLGYTEDQDQYFVDYLTMLKGLRDDGVMPPYDDAVARRGLGVEDSYIVTGQAVMDYMWSNQIVAIWTAAGEDRNFVMYPVPRVDDGQSRNYFKPSMFFSITRDSQNPEEAAKFIDWFTNSVEANEILFAERGVPVSSEIREALLPELGAAQKEMFDYLGRLEDYNSPIRPPDPIAHADLINNIYWPEAIDPAMYGMMSIEEGVAILREEAARLLAASE
jgi:multiple sugar transport system substrate-binding protein